MAADETLGSDENTTGKAAHFTVILVILGVFAFSLANLTQPAQQLANFFLLFSISPLVALIYDMVARQTKGKPEIPDTVTIEKHSIIFGEMGRTAKALVIGGSLMLGGALFLYIGGQSTLALVSSPTFQLISPGPAGSAFLSGAAGLIENLFFFAFGGPTFFVVLSRLLGNIPGRKAIALAMSVIFMAGVFTLYHVGVYGESAETLDTVFYFGLFCGGSTVVLGNIVPCHSLHFFNNFSIGFFTQTSADVFLWVLLYWLLIAAGTFAYLRRGS